MDIKWRITTIAFIVLLTGCQEENWDGDTDGKMDDLSFWWVDSPDWVYLECLNNSDASPLRMRKSGNTIETGPHKTKVNHHYLNNYGWYLRVMSGCSQTKYSYEWKRSGYYEYKHVTETITSRFRFRIGDAIGYIFSEEEKKCFRDPQQSSNLVQRAYDCNTDKENDAYGLTETYTRTYTCYTVADTRPHCSRPRLVDDWW